MIEEVTEKGRMQVGKHSVFLFFCLRKQEAKQWILFVKIKGWMLDSEIAKC